MATKWLRVAMLSVTLAMATGSAANALASEADDRLNALFQREWEWVMKESPTWASYLGDRRYNDQWGAVGPGESARRDRHAADVLAELDSFNNADLSEESRLNLALFRRSLTQGREYFRFAEHLMPIDQRGGIQTEDDTASALRFETVKDYEDWIARLRGFASYMDGTIALLREGVRRGIVQPRIVMDRVPRQIERQIVTDPAQSGFYKPFEQMAAGISEPDRQRLRTEAKAAIEQAVVPSFRSLLRFFNDEYLPAATDGIGAWRLPEGDQRYASAARRFTTTDLTPDQIHDIGLSEVARIRAEMESVRTEVGFTGDLSAFFLHMRSDPRFFYSTGDELLAGYRAVSKKIDPLIVPLFGKLPRMPYGVEAIPDNIAPDTTTAYYRSPSLDGSRAGSYFVNLYRPESRPKWEMTALSLHEAVPGHHLQIALAQELGDGPEFRKHAGYTAFIEGWGLYAESLGYDMRLYDAPYDRFGALTYEMWRACRLVVDTGMHHKRWTRDQAIDFMKSNTARSELDIVNEVDRYITWPGQALAYKIGELRIKALRKHAQTQLGDKFSLPAFHDVVLGAGAVPLDILDHRVNAWIDSVRSLP